MQLNLLVLRAREPHRLAEFYRAMGLDFLTERHGNGPEHLSCETAGGILEIYPCRDESRNTRSVRLGFAVENLDASCLAAAASLGRLVRQPHPTPWGRRAIIEDPEGHVIDLVEGELVVSRDNVVLE